MFLDTFYSDCYAPTRHGDAAQTTRSKVRGLIRRFSDWLGRRATTDDLSDEMIARFRVAELERGIARDTAQSYASYLIAMANIAWRMGLIPRGPILRPLRAKHREAVILTPVQTAALFRAASELSGEVGGALACVWWTALLAMAYDTGMRRGDLLALMWPNIEMPERMVDWVAAKTGKRAVRVFSERTAAAIERLPQDRPTVFWHPFSEARLFQLQRQLFCYAGLPANRSYGLHSLRRKHGDLVREASGLAAASEALQHSSQAVTEGFYSRPKPLDFSSFLPDPLG